MTRRRTLGQFLLTAALAGTGFVGIKAGLSGVPPLLFAAVRFDVAAVVLLGLLALRHDAWLPRTRGDLLGVLTGGVLIVAVTNSLLFVGQQDVTSGFAAVVFSVVPVATPAFAFVLLPDDRPTMVGLVGIALGFVGVVVVVQPTPATVTASSAVGGVLVALAAASLALGTVLLRRVRPSLSSLGITAWSMPVGSLSLHAVSLAVGESPSSVTLTPATVTAVLYVGLLSTALLYPLLFGLLRRLGPVRTNLYAYLSPVVATVVGWLAFGDGLALTTVVGFVVIASGFALVERRTLRDEGRRLYDWWHADRV